MKPLHAGSQCSRILRHLVAGNGITRIEAVRLFGACNLWARCAELECRGHKIRREPRVKVGKRKYVTRYWLVRR
jgi:hypothetical protein